MKTVLKIEFDSKEASDHFASWLCESGEQSYWDWMEYREDEEEGDITATSFEYHAVLYPDADESNPDRYGEFMADDTIRTTCGRLDR